MASSHNVKLWRARFKQRIVDEFGGKCSICSYNKCAAALELHHLDPTLKDPSFSKFRSSPSAIEKVAKELTKCILVCANCHREIHYNNLEVPNKPSIFDEVAYLTKYKVKSKEKKTLKEVAIEKQLINWAAEYANLIKLKDTENISFVQIAKIYKVSDKTIAKHYYKAKKYSEVAELVNASDC